VTQGYLAVREKLNDAQDQSRVAKTLETKLEGLRPDDDGGGGGAAYGDGGPGNEKKAAGSEADMLVPPGDNIIDIRV
jgi:hypothetical protein